MRTSMLERTGRILFFCAFLLPISSASQMPAPLGKLHITSTNAGASITINNVRRKEVTRLLSRSFQVRTTLPSALVRHSL